MDENGTYRWAPETPPQPKPPKKKPDFKRAGKTMLVVLLALILLGLAGTTILGVAVWYYGSLTAQSYLFAPLTALSALALLFLWGVLLHLFPMTVEAPGDGIFRRALQHAAVRMGRTLVALVLMIAVLAAQVLYFPVSVPITLFIGLIFPGLIGIFAYLDREDLV